MAQKVENVISSKLYAEMVKKSIPAKVAAADNKQIEVFNSANNPVKDKVDYFISEKETEEISDKKEKTKNILKTIGLTALGIGVIAGGIFLLRNKCARNKITNNFIEETNKCTHNKVTNNPIEETIDGVNDYLKEHCKVYREIGHDSRSFTVIEANNGEIIELSKLGELNKRGTIVRYKTPEQAKQGAIEIVMKQFEVPLEQQRELAVVTNGRDLYLNNFQGGPTSCCTPIFDTKDFEVFHNHPDAYGNGKTLPLSFPDIKNLLANGEKSITAINSVGEFNTITRTSTSDYQKLLSKLSYKGYFRELTLVRLAKLRDLKQKNELTPELIKELKHLEYYVESTFYDLLLHEPKKYYAEICHEAYKEIFPKYGFEYTTNFSNLMNL